jgi:integrase/recombinase XerD
LDKHKVGAKKEAVSNPQSRSSYLDVSAMGEMAIQAAKERMTTAQKQRMILLAERFDEWLAAINYSPKTRVNYLRDVKGFITWLADNSSIASIVEVTPAELQQYQMAIYNYERSLVPASAGPEAHVSVSVEKKRLAVGTQACRLAAVRKFFSWLAAEQQIAYNPASALQPPKQPQRLPANVLTRNEAKRLIESTPTDRPRDIRDRAILEVLYSTGIRRAELIGLTIYDLDFDNATLRIERGKGGSTRIVPLTETARSALKLYLEEARGAFARETTQTRLFVSSRSGGPLDDADIVRIVEKAARRAKIKKHITPHTLRHTCATHLLKGKADIRQIQKLLGHRRLSSTEVYTHVEISDLREVISRCHPREKKRDGETR